MKRDLSLDDKMRIDSHEEEKKQKNRVIPTGRI